MAALLEERFDFPRYSDEADEEPAPHELHQDEEPVLAAVPDEEQLASEEVSLFDFSQYEITQGFVARNWY